MTTLTAGDKAPDFTGKDQDGKKVSLKDFKGKKVVLYFYPKDDTPGCTTQACNLRDNFSVLKEAGIEVIGVSPDSAESHQKFTLSHEFDCLCKRNLHFGYTKIATEWALVVIKIPIFVILF